MGHTHYWLSVHCSHQKCQTSYSQYHCQQMSTQHQTKKNQTNHSNHCQMGTDHQCQYWKGILVHLHLCRRGLPGAPGVLAESFCVFLYRTSSRPTGSWTPEVWAGTVYIVASLACRNCQDWACRMLMTDSCVRNGSLCHMPNTVCPTLGSLCGPLRVAQGWRNHCMDVAAYGADAQFWCAPRRT